MNNHSNQDFKIFGVKGYTIMSNYHLRDKNLSLKAKGLLSFMLSLPDDWDYSIKGLSSVLKEGRKGVTNVLNELKEAEYLKIDEHRDEFGRFKYKYSIYYLPYSKWLEMSKFTEAPLRDTDKGTQINTNKQIDKIDKEIEHHNLTKILIEKNYINETESSSFYFDDLFESLLEDGHEYKNLIKYTNYILQKLKENNYEDEEGNKIKNKFGYFKNAIISNIKKLEISDEELFDPDEYNWLDDFDL